MTVTSIVILVFLLSAIPQMSEAQEHDFGTNLSVGLQKRYDKRFETGYEIELRTRDDVKAIDRISVRAQASYKVLPWLKATVGLSALGDHNKRISRYDEDDKDVVRGKVEVGAPKNLREYWGARLRGDFSLTGSKDIGVVRLSLRERWQYTYRFHRYVQGRYNFLYQRGDETVRYYRGKGKNELRSRLQAELHLPHWRVTPFASVEAFNAWDVEKVRYTAGATWKINKRHTLELYYRFDDLSYDHDYEPCKHVLGLSYQYHIKKK